MFFLILTSLSFALSPSLVIQVINSGGDLGPKQFDLQIPGEWSGQVSGVGR